MDTSKAEIFSHNIKSEAIANNEMVVDKKNHVDRSDNELDKPTLIVPASFLEMEAQEEAEAINFRRLIQTVGRYQ